MKEELTSEQRDNMGNSIRTQILENIVNIGNVIVRLPMVDKDRIDVEVWPAFELNEDDFLKSMCKIQNQYEKRIYVTFMWPVCESRDES